MLLTRIEERGNIDRSPILLALARTHERKGEWSKALKIYRDAAYFATSEDLITTCKEGAERALVRTEKVRWSVSDQA